MTDCMRQHRGFRASAAVLKTVPGVRYSIWPQATPKVIDMQTTGHIETTDDRIRRTFIEMTWPAAIKQLRKAILEFVENRHGHPNLKAVDGSQCCCELCRAWRDTSAFE